MRTYGSHFALPVASALRRLGNVLILFFVLSEKFPISVFSLKASNAEADKKGARKKERNKIVCC
jgi:hypothetical protein